jgi:hypothetical protein
VVAVFLLACSDKNQIVPDEESGVPGTKSPDTAIVAGLVASDALPLSALSASVQASATFADTHVAFLSAVPGTFPGKDSVLVSNRTRSAVPRLTKVAEGGFDPIAISAESDDLLELTVFVAGGTRPEPLLVKVPRRRPPVIVRTNPPRWRVDVALNVQITVVFSEPMDKSTITLRLMLGDQAVSGNVNVAEDGLSAEFTPDNQLEPETTYQLRFGEGLRDLDGDALADNTAVTFSTAPLPEAIAFRLAGTGLYVVDSDGKNLVLLGNGGSPAWMPAGSLLFIREDCTECPGELWIRTRDGNTSLLLGKAADGRGFRDPAPTRDGSRIAMIRNGETSNLWSSFAHPANELIIMTISDRSLYRVPLPDGVIPMRKPSWSPDESRIVFTCKENTQDGWADLCFIDTDGSNFVRYGKPNEDEMDPAWSWKSGLIAFTRLISIGGDTYGSMGVMTDEVGTSLTIFPGVEGPAWSPDGNTLLYCRPPLLATNMTTGVQRQIFSFPGQAFMYQLAWGRK